MSKLTIKTLTRVAILIALEIVLNRFLSFNTMQQKIGFSFIAIAVCGYMFGPWIAALAGALADFLGAVLFPIGAFFPGFTLTAALTGLCFGLFLHRKKVKFFPHMFFCAFINCAVLSLGLNTYWVSVISGTPFWVLATTTRLIQFGINFALQLALLPLLKQLTDRLDSSKKGNI